MIVIRNTRSAAERRIVQLRAKCSAIWVSLNSSTIESLIELDHEIDALEVNLSTVPADSLRQLYDPDLEVLTDERLD